MSDVGYDITKIEKSNIKNPRSAINKSAIKKATQQLNADGSCLYLPFPYLFCLRCGKKLPVLCLLPAPSGAP
jgi:hypothetical protein